MHKGTYLYIALQHLKGMLLNDVNSRASSGMWVAGRSDIKALFSIHTRQRSNNTRVILREKHTLEEGGVAGKMTPATNYIPTEDKYELIYTINMYATLQH